MKNLKTYSLFESQSIEANRYLVIEWTGIDPDETVVNGGKWTVGKVVIDSKNPDVRKVLPIRASFDVDVLTDLLYRVLRNRSYGSVPYTAEMLNSVASAYKEAAEDRLYPDSGYIQIEMKVTPIYKDPEIVQALKIKGVSDLFRMIGVVDYRMLGYMYIRMVYQGDSYLKAMDRIRNAIEGGDRSIVINLGGSPWPTPKAVELEEELPKLAIFLDSDKLDSHIKANPMDMDLLDPFPDIKKEVLKRTGMEDVSDLARLLRQGLI